MFKGKGVVSTSTYWLEPWQGFWMFVLILIGHNRIRPPSPTTYRLKNNKHLKYPLYQSLLSASLQHKSYRFPCCMCKDALLGSAQHASICDSVIVFASIIKIVSRLGPEILASNHAHVWKALDALQPVSLLMIYRLQLWWCFWIFKKIEI